MAHEKDAEPNERYVAFHRPRFSFLLDVLRKHVGQEAGRVLDVGRSPLTALLARELRTPVDSLGLEPDEELSTGRHHCFDLNETQFPERCRTGPGPYDVIVFAEVLEHLYTAPELVLAYVRRLLRPGGLLLLQTPNAVSLSKRMKLALGINPFGRIRVDKANPGHFREYTLAELKEVLKGADFSVEKVWRRHYSDVRFARHETGHEPPAWISGALRNATYRVLPPSLREGITILARSGR
jgi:SAM-dependent methyltransferase